MQAELISIGDELLMGQTINTNAAFIARQLLTIGVPVKWTTVVADDEADIEACLDHAATRAQVIITTGGLGPTHDDVTRKVFVRYFKTSLELDEAVLKNIERLFANRNKPMPKSNRDQAMIPKSATIIPNDFGTAPGFRFNRDDAVFVVLPGVPLEMKTMMQKTVIPYLKKKSDRFIKYKMIKTTGVSESALYELMGDIEALEQIVKIAFLPKPSGVEIRLTVEDSTEQACLDRIATAEKIILSRIDQYVWGYGDEKLEEIISKILLKQNKTLAILECSTGGLITNQLTNLPQSQQFLICARIVSDPDVLSAILPESKTIIRTSGMQCAKLAIALAERVRKLANADFGLATTPFLLSESDQKQEQHVFVAIASATGTSTDSTFVNRDIHFNKERPAQLALDVLRRVLMS